MIKALLRWLVLMVVIISLGVATLLTPIGLKIIFAVVSKTLPGELSYQKVSGTLLSPLTIRQISYHYHGEYYSASQIYLRWYPLTLIRGKLSLSTLNIETLKVTRPALAPAPSPRDQVAGQRIGVDEIEQWQKRITSFKLPVKIRVDELHISRLFWGEKPNEYPIQIANIDALGTLDPENFNVNIISQVMQPYTIKIQLIIKGTPQNYTLQFTAKNQDTDWVIDGFGTPESIQLDTRKAKILRGFLSSHLIWHWKIPYQWELFLEGQHLDLSLIQTNWPRSLNLHVNSMGILAAEHPSFSWQGFIKTPKTQLTTTGNYQQRWDISWQLNAKDLGELIPFTTGSIHSSGELHGDMKTPQTKGNFNAKNLHWKDFRIDKLLGEWDLDFSEKNNSHFFLQAEQIFAQNIQLDKFNLAGQGKRSFHQLTAKISAYQSIVDMILAGNLSNNQWQGSLKKLTIQAPYAGQWRLTQSAALLFSAQKVAIPLLCLESTATNKLCLKGEWLHQGAWQLALAGKFNLDQLSQFFPEDLKVNIPMDIHADFRGTPNNLREAQFSSDASTGYIRYAFPNNRLLNLTVNRAHISSRFNKSGLDSNISLDLGGKNMITGNIKFPPLTAKLFSPQQQPIKGQFNVNLNNVGPIADLIPNIVNEKGKIQGRFDLSGTLGHPLTSGNLTYSQGNVKIPAFNLNLNTLTLVFNSEGSQFKYSLKAINGQEPITVIGQSDLSQPGNPTNLQITSNNALLLMNSPKYQIFATPNLNLAITGHTINITGSLLIPRADIRALEFVEETTLPEGEVVFVGSHSLKKESFIQLSSEIKLILGDDVKVNTPGLKARLTGDLTVISAPGQPTIGVGRINLLDGTYIALGKTLPITPNSALLFRRNPINNPILNIQVTNRVEISDTFNRQLTGTSVLNLGMNIGGTASSPQISFFSSAGNLSQADILSYMFFGSPSSGISPTSMGLLMQAVNNLPLTKRTNTSEGLTSRLRKSFGLSEIGVESSTTLGPLGEPINVGNPTSYLVVGKRIAPRLYLRYKYDPFYSVNVFQLNYLLSHHWSFQVETDTNNQSGADVIYTIETGNPAPKNDSAK